MPPDTATQSPTPPAQTPPPLSTIPPPNPEAGQHTIQSLAGRFRAKFPTGTTGDGIPYAKLPDDEMVRRVIQKQPVYQTWLNQDSLQQLASKGAPTFGSTVKDILGGAPSPGDIYRGAKNFFSEDPITRVSRGVDEAISDTRTAKERAAASPHTSLPLRALASIPVVGPPAVGAVENINEGLQGPTPLADPSNPAYKGMGELGHLSGQGALVLGGEKIAPEVSKNLKPAVNQATSKVRNAIAPPPDVASGMAYENAVAPGGLGAAEQESLRSDWLRARKYIGAQTDKMPVPKGEGAVMRAATTTRKAANELWQSHVEPVIDKFAEAGDSTSDIAQKIRETPSEIDVATRPAIQKKIDRLANVFDRDMTVKEMNAKVTELNADPAVNKYYEMNGSARAQALNADPTLHGKVVALDELREKMFDTISDNWTDEGGAMFREARKDYGSLRNVEQNFREAKVPTPKPLSTRIANTARVSISPHAATEYLRNPVSTIFDLNNPNRLAAKAVNKAGKVGEGIPAPPELPQNVAPLQRPPQYSSPIGPPPPPEQFPYAPAAPIPAPPSTPGFSPIQPPTPGTTGWSNVEAPVKQGAEQRNLWGRPVATGSTETTPGGMIISAPPSGLVKQEFGKIGLSDLVTPRQSTTLETLMRGPRWKDMDRAERVAAVNDILGRGTGAAGGAIQTETDSMGIRWAKSGQYRVSIPKSVSDSEIESYARPKLEEQARIHKGIK